MGTCYAVPTKDHSIKTLPIAKVEHYITLFLVYASSHPELEFQVTRIGCGLAGFRDQQIAPMFRGAPKNCFFDSAWRHWLGDEYTYWGSL